jgi:phospholipid/cholesterol/gamma-HCH transport system substrate-binding protein
MKIKFNKFERVAGLFVLIAVVGAITATIAIAVKKGWFESKIHYETMVESADGIRKGTLVQVSGIRAGQVQSVELVSAKEIKVNFEVLEKFRNQLREDSQVQIVRPFVIGDKVLELTVGSADLAVLPEGVVIASKPSMDLMDLLSGRTLGPFLGTVEKLTSSLELLMTAFTDRNRIESFVKVFDRLEPLVQNLNAMSIRVTKITDVANKNKRVEKIVISLTQVSEELEKVLPILSANAPQMAEQVPMLISNLAVLTEEFKKLTPAITAIAPELPRASKRAIEALDETVITLKSLQRSFFLRGSASDVREEEQTQRAPASSGKPKK